MARGAWIHPGVKRETQTSCVSLETSMALGFSPGSWHACLSKASFPAPHLSVLEGAGTRVIFCPLELRLPYARCPYPLQEAWGLCAAPQNGRHKLSQKMHSSSETQAVVWAFFFHYTFFPMH